MNKPNAAFGGFRQDVLREAAQIVGECVSGIDHDSFCGPRMGALSLKRDSCSSRAPCFIADLTKSLTIDRVGHLCTETFDIKLFNPAIHFFVWSECNC